MTTFVGRYPSRVRHLVYLDAAYDMAKAYETALNAQLTPSSDLALEGIDRGARQTPLDDRVIEVPALAFFVLYDRPAELPRMTAAEKDWSRRAFVPFELGYKREQVEVFKRNDEHGQVIELHDSDHFFFQDPKQGTRPPGPFCRFSPGRNDQMTR
jgi:hypothetical protein